MKQKVWYAPTNFLHSVNNYDLTCQHKVINSMLQNDFKSFVVTWLMTNSMLPTYYEINHINITLISMWATVTNLMFVKVPEVHQSLISL